MDNNIINTAARVITALATVALVYSVYVARQSLDTEQKNIHDAYERSQKEFGVNILLNNIDKINLGLYCMNFFADLSPDEIDKIANHEATHIDDQHIPKLKQCIVNPNEEDLFNSSKKSLTKFGSYYVKSSITNALNMLETIAIANCNDLIDKNIMKVIIESANFPEFEAAFYKINNFGTKKSYVYLEDYLKTNKCSFETTN